MVCSSALERLIHVVPKVCALWEQDGFEAYVNGLVFDSRDGQRQGLPADVQAELMFLVELRIAKRALTWSEAAGLPFREVFLQYLEKAQKTSVVESRAGDAWADPHARQSLSLALYGKWVTAMREGRDPAQVRSLRAAAEKNDPGARNVPECALNFPPMKFVADALDGLGNARRRDPTQHDC